MSQELQKDDLEAKTTFELWEKLEEFTKPGRFKKYLNAFKASQGTRTIVLTTLTVKLLDWFSTPAFWSLADFVYQGIRFWLFGVG